MATTSTLPGSPVTGAATEAGSRANSFRRAVPLLLYCLTGFSGVLAEQGFEKYIALLVGATASASAVVLFTYFLGFALGSVATGRLLKKAWISRPMLIYGLLELLVGISCIAFSYSFHGLLEKMAPLQNLFDSAAMKFEVRFICACALVLPTAALMGASFPLIAAALDGRDSMGNKKNWSGAYCANLAGAFLAALITPFAILPVIGLRGALWLCFAIGAGVCAVSWALAEPSGAADGRSTHELRTPGKPIRLLLAASFASGVVVFALEVIWTHLIGVVIGCSVYAFSWMLTAVLLGLLIGAFLVSRGVRQGNLIGLPTLFLCSVLMLLVQLALWDRVPLLFGVTPPVRFQNSFYFAESFKLYVTCILLVPQSTLLGLIYPRLLASSQPDGHGNSYLAGYLSAANSLGCLTGALLGTFVLVPMVGSELSLKLLIVILGAFWLLFLRREPLTLSRWARTAVVAAAILCVIGYWHWDWRVLTVGFGNYFGAAPLPPVSTAATPKPVSLSHAIIFRHEDMQGGVTTVMEQAEMPERRHVIRLLYTNGKFQGDDDPAGQINAQFGFAAIPSMFVPQDDRVLLIGLGTGHSAAALRRLGYREIDIAEVAPGIVRAASQQFAGLNERILSDPRVRLRLEDGRNVLLTDSHRTYDMITIEISSIWFAGATNLYSQEFYELAKKRLKPEGVLQQWVQLHHISPREIGCDLATARSVFPYVGLWYYGNQGMLVAANHPLMKTEKTIEHFRSTGLSSEDANRLVDELDRARLVSSEGVEALIRDVHPQINTDHNRWLEYATPRYQSSSFDWTTYNRAYLAKYK